VKRIPIVFVGTLATLLLAVGWTEFRFYVPPGYMAVLTAKVGTPLPAGQILAQPGQQGIQEAVLGEGRHFRDPLFYDWEILPALTIPTGKVGLVVSKIGRDLPEGEFLADPGQKGIWRQVLGPGRYRLNPYGYRVELADAISIPIGYVGVVTGLSGKQASVGEFAGPGEKGVRKDVLQPGLYYVNPKELRVDVLEIGVNQVSLVGTKGGEVITKAQIATQNVAMQQLSQHMLAEQKEKRMDYMTQRGLSLSSAVSSYNAPRKTRDRELLPASQAASQIMLDKSEKADVAKKSAPDTATFLNLDQVVEFPSRDGFEISLDMTVEFELLPENIASIYQSYGDLPAVVDKIIMPQILSVSRLKGSAYRAKDFIVGEGRQQFQNDLTETLAHTLASKRIVIHNALIRHVNVPVQILDPIQQASVAVEQNLTNKEKQNTARKQADLNTEQGLIEQRREQVAQETEKLKAEIGADQEKQVAEIRAEAQRQVAEVQKQTANMRADQSRILGQAKAQVVSLVEGEKAAGFTLNSAALGDPNAYLLWEFANSLNDQLRVNILHAGVGTLWTDLDHNILGDLGAAKVLKQ
jgi:regulator of protease activity HflC (stomatin/prohibitin superfamily)